MFVELENEDSRWSEAFPVLQELRPELTFELFQSILREAAPQGLRYTALYEEDECVAVTGWRVVSNTIAVRMMYVDDLATSSRYRSRGHGARLVEALTEKARLLGCRTLQLDSGVQRSPAHRFYLRERLAISAFHFEKTL